MNDTSDSIKSKLDRSINAIVELSNHEAIYRGDIETMYKLVCKLATETLRVSRVSIWLYKTDPNRIVRVYLFEDQEGNDDYIELLESDYPIYFKAIKNESIITATDARTDKSTSEFSESYLPSLNIYSLLDACFEVDGEFAGVICCEHQHETYSWNPEDLIVIKSMVNIISLTQKNDSINTFVKVIEHQNQELVSKKNEIEEANKKLQINNEELTTTLEKLKETHNLLIHSEKMASLGILVAGVGHEINNPLNFISSGIIAVRQLLKESDKSTSQIEELLDIMEIGVVRTTEIVKSLRKFSSNSGDSLIKCKVHHIIDDCLLMLNNEIKKGVNIIKEYHEDYLVAIGNNGEYHQVFLNIITNAIHAVENSGTIKISSKIDGNYLLIAVKDNGCGIQEENLLKIWDPFFTTKNAKEGTGLGLYITYSLVKRNKGNIEVNSKIGEGTEFILKLPIE